jgi:hypothetical protein
LTPHTKRLHVIDAILPHIAVDYGGSYWLGPFAMLALDGISVEATA